MAVLGHPCVLVYKSTRGHSCNTCTLLYLCFHEHCCTDNHMLWLLVITWTHCYEVIRVLCSASELLLQGPRALQCRSHACCLLTRLCSFLLRYTCEPSLRSTAALVDAPLLVFALCTSSRVCSSSSSSMHSLVVNTHQLAVAVHYYAVRRTLVTDVCALLC